MSTIEALEALGKTSDPLKALLFILRSFFPSITRNDTTCRHSCLPMHVHIASCLSPVSRPAPVPADLDDPCLVVFQFIMISHKLARSVSCSPVVYQPYCSILA